MDLNMEDAQTVAWIAGVSSVVLGVIIILSTLCCIRCGCCGPRTLKKGDVAALATFKDMYFYQQIDIPQGSFDKAEESAYCKLWTYKRPSKPVLNWSSLMNSSSSGFLQPIAREIDDYLLAWQHRMWNAKGDFVSNFPTFLVAQEWREWAMTELPRIEAPHMEYKEMLDRRLRWIANAREVARTEIMDLRSAVGWDETDELSLLVVLRQHVGRQLRLVHDRWSSYQLQLSFEKQADMMNGFLTQFVRSGANFLKRILRQDKVNDKDFLNVVESGNILSQPCGFCSSYKKWEAHALDRELEKWIEEVALFDPQFPSKSRTLFFSGKRLKELEDGTSKVRPLQPLSPFAKWDESRLDFTEREMANEVLKGLKADQFGLKEHEFKVMVQRAVTMLSALKYCTVSLMVIESLKHFARLGGALFLAEKMSSDHVVEIMKFVGLSLDSAESDLIAVADTAQAGWSNLRRGDYQSNWSNTSPVDNVRAALHVKTDMVKMARDARETVKLVQAEATKAEKVEASDVEEKLESELKFHLQLWQLISKHFEKTARKGEEKQQAFSAASGEPGEDPNDKAKLQVTIEI